MNARIQILHFTRNLNLYFTRSYRQEKRVVITGLGCICPLGNDVKLAWENVIKGKCGVRSLESDEYKDLPCRVGAPVDYSTLRGYDLLEKYSMFPDATKLAIIAAAEAITDAGLDMDDKNELVITGMAFGSQALNIDRVVKKYKTYDGWLNDKTDHMDPNAVINQMLHLNASILSYKYNLGGPIFYPCAGAASGLVAIGTGFHTIQGQQSVDIMICGSTGSRMNPFYVALLSKLGFLSTKFNDEPSGACRPFDRERDGEVCGEGTGVLILEELNHAVLRNARIYCEIKGFSTAAGINLKSVEESHIKGIMTSMNQALVEARILPENVSYIHAHGCGSIDWDYFEAVAIQKLFGDRSWELFVSSTKGATGTMGTGTSAVETVFAALAIYTSTLPPTLNWNSDTSQFILNFVPNSTEYYSRRKILIKNSRSSTGLTASLCMTYLDPKTVVVRT